MAASSNFASLRNVVRTAIRDKAGTLFDDAALDRIINEAQREYSLLSGSLIGTFQVTAGTDSVFYMPYDFIEPVKFIGADGLQKPFYSWKLLNQDFPDFRVLEGTEIRGIIVDFDGFGKFRMFPKLPEGTPVGTMYYRRTPKENVVETTNVDAITQYALFYTFLLDSKSSAAVYYDRFVEAVNDESKLQRSLKNRSGIRRGRFF